MTQPNPNFFIVRALKCGTTAVFNYLRTHPDVYFNETAKEPHHYNADMPGFQWFKSSEDYLGLYDNLAASDAKIRGDASVQYLYSKVAAHNIAHEAPDAKILICLREPAAFIRSYHNQMLVNADEDEMDLRTCWNLSNTHRMTTREPKMLDYKSMGLFAEQIDRYRAAFPDAQIHVLKLEDFSADPRGHYLALLTWLNLPDDRRDDFQQIHGAATIKTRRLANLLKSPPPWVKTGTRAIKNALGMTSLGIAKKISNANKTKGYATQLDTSLADDIKTHYAADQSALANHSDLFLKPPPFPNAG